MSEQRFYAIRRRVRNLNGPLTDMRDPKRCHESTEDHDYNGDELLEPIHWRNVPESDSRYCRRRLI